MQTDDNKTKVEMVSRRRSMSPKANGIGLWNQALALAGVIGCFASVLAPAPVMAAPVALVKPAGTGLCATATMDGDAAEWNLDAVGSWDFYQPMYQDGDPTKPILANLYLRSKGGKVYVMVRAAPGNFVNPDGLQAWVKNQVFASPLVPWDQGTNPLWVGDGLGNVIGYEASFMPPKTPVPQPPYEFNVSVSSGGVLYPASTRSKKAGNIRLIMPDCRVGIGDRVYLEVNGVAGYQPDDDDVPAPKDLDIEVVNADTNAVTVAKTDREGCFLVEGLAEGRYFVRMRKEVFEINGKLYRFTPATPYTGADVTPIKDDDADHNGFGDAGAVVTGAYQLEPGTMPVTNLRPGGVETSGDRACQYTTATLPDPNVNRTADIGLAGEKVAIGNLVWRENPFMPGQTEGRFESAYDFPAKGLTVYLDLIDPYAEQDGCRPDSPDIKTTLIESTDAATGFFLFDQLVPGSFRLRIDQGEFTDGQLKGYLVSNGFAVDPALVGDDNADHNAVQAGDPSLGGACTATFDVWPGYAPTNEPGLYQGEKGRQESDLPDENVDLTRDLAFARDGGDPPNIMSIGSAVWVDANHDGKQTAGWTDLNRNGVQDPGEVDEPGIPNVTLELSGGGLTSPMTTTTAADGTYLFKNLPPASNYVVTVPAKEMIEGAADGGHLAVFLKDYYAKRGISKVNVPVRALATLYTAITWDDKRDGDNNGRQVGTINANLPPSASTATGVELRSYQEPVDGTGANDEFASGKTQDQDLAPDPDFPDESPTTMDQSGDMTIDFGFVHVCQEICDIDGNGKVESSDLIEINKRGINNLKVDKTDLAHTGNCQQTGIVSRNDYVYCNRFVAPNAKN